VNILKTTELYTSNESAIWYVDFISTKVLKYSGEGWVWFAQAYNVSLSGGSWFEASPGKMLVRRPLSPCQQACWAWWHTAVIPGTQEHRQKDSPRSIPGNNTDPIQKITKASKCRRHGSSGRSPA
jgi:hypothetical protein